MVDKKRRASLISGFTLIEITFAVLILAASMITFLGLQSFSIQRTIQDQNKTQAMLLARQILAAIEKTSQEIQVGERTEDPYTIIREFLPGTPIEEPEPNSPVSFTANFKVEEWEMADIKLEGLLKLTLTLSWSASPRDTLTVAYFIPGQVEEGEEDEL